MSEVIDQLNQALLEVSAMLVACKFGVTAEVDLNSETRLAFLKEQNQWGLFVKDLQGSGAFRVALANTSKRTRIMAANALPALYAALRKRRDESDEETRQALRVVLSLIDQIDAETPEEEPEKESDG